MEISQAAGEAIVNQAIKAISEGKRVTLLVQGIEGEVSASGLELSNTGWTVHVANDGLSAPAVLACHAIIGARFRKQ